MSGDHHWVCTWAGALQGVYPMGSAVAQPDLQAALPDPARGLRDQSLRMVIRPGLWAPRLRFRLSNVFGTRPIEVGAAGLGLHLGGGAVVPGSWREARFDGQSRRVLAPGEHCWTDPVEVAWYEDASVRLLDGRTLAIGWHVFGESGPVSWHAKAMGTSYLSDPGTFAESSGGDEAFPHATTSWYLLDAVDAWLPADAHAVVAFGDSLTDGTNTTLNGHDRWPDVLQRRLRAGGHHRIAVVNAGIGGNQVAGPRQAPGMPPWRGGPPAVQRLDRDVLGLSGVRTVIWLEGINDFSDNGAATADTVHAALRTGVARLRAAGLHVWGATVPSALNGRRDGHGGATQDAHRRTLNGWLRATPLFDRLLDFDAELTDPATGMLRADCASDSTLGGAGDFVHPNRAGHLRMAGIVDVAALAALAPLSAPPALPGSPPSERPPSA